MEAASKLAPSLMLSLTIILMALAPFQLTAQVNVTTWHNDNWRTGENTNETALSVSSMGQKGFGNLCHVPLPSTPQQEVVCAQPLVVD